MESEQPIRRQIRELPKRNKLLLELLQSHLIRCFMEIVYFHMAIISDRLLLVQSIQINTATAF